MVGAQLDETILERNRLKKNEKKISPLFLVALLLLVVVWGGYQLFVRYEGRVPGITVVRLPAHVGASGELVLEVSDVGSGLQKVWVALSQDGKETVLLEKSFAKTWFGGGSAVMDLPVSLSLSPKEYGFSDGEALVRVAVRDCSWRRWWHGNLTYLEKPIVIDTVPARIDVMSQAHNITQGGAGVAVYRLSETCVRSGVRVGDNFFPGHAGYFADTQTLLCFFALRHDQGRGTAIALEAEDAAGNTATMGIAHYIRGKQFKADVINISDGFLDRKLPEFGLGAGSDTQASPVEKFLTVNRRMRQENRAAIVDIARTTDPVLHWKGAFERLPRAAPMASFGEQRTYRYGGNAIDHQTHLGVDLASVARSPVPAGNAGRVAFAGAIGIYGNIVMIDHGCGLFSTYSHLSRIDVHEGQHVARAEVIGLTGMTGMAGGDHLHYAVFIHNTFVNPYEWWDAVWIQNNVTANLSRGGPTADAGSTSGGSPQ